MKLVRDYFSELANTLWDGWNRFWFTPTDPATLGTLRIGVGLMLFYTHLVWTLELDAFFGKASWISPQAAHSWKHAKMSRREMVLLERERAEIVESQKLEQREAEARGNVPTAAFTPGALTMSLEEAAAALPGGEDVKEPQMAGLDVPAVEELRAEEGLPDDPMWKPSHLWYVSEQPYLSIAHFAALAVFAMFAAGLWTRWTSILAWALTISYANRLPGAMFGLDQLNAVLTTYLMIGPSGASYSIDRLLAGKLEQPSVGANISIRLIQLNMCLIYFLAGTSKLNGDFWWEGTAMWMSFANVNYQTLDMTWTKHFPALLAFICHATVLWELTYAGLVWPRLTRPLVIGMAVLVHAGIGMCLGMITFATIMIIGNMSFVSPALVRRIVERRDDVEYTPAAEPLAVAGPNRTAVRRGQSVAQNV
ncbi:MAG TPA: HTTM domain-containing protein [Pirellulales bacterium]